MPYLLFAIQLPKFIIRLLFIMKHEIVKNNMREAEYKTKIRGRLKLVSFP